MIPKLQNISDPPEPSKELFSQREKDFLDLVCNFLVDDIIQKVNDEKKGNRLRKN